MGALTAVFLLSVLSFSVFLLLESFKTPVAHAADRSQMNEITWTKTSFCICFTYLHVRFGVLI